VSFIKVPDSAYLGWRGALLQHLNLQVMGAGFWGGALWGRLSEDAVGGAKEKALLERL
jgi:hypothetical protein